MKCDLKINLMEKDRLTDIGKALSSPLRLDILYYLSEKPAIIANVAEYFQIPASSAALHIKTLANAGLIFVQPIPGSKGAQKLCGVLVSRIDIHMFHSITENNQHILYQTSIPIGSYFDYDVYMPCGIVSELNYIGTEDSLGEFYSPDRFKAQLIWLSTGFLEYRFANTIFKTNTPNKVQISFEICSEALGYNNNWRSDVSIWVNGIEIGVIECLGDYGGRKGKLNPDWWSDSSTQYGDLRNVWITDKGCFIDDKQVSNHTIKSLQLDKHNYISFKIGVKPDAKYVGGFNLFGEKFGDYPQNINMIVYDDENSMINNNQDIPNNIEGLSI